MGAAGHATGITRSGAVRAGLAALAVLPALAALPRPALAEAWYTGAARGAGPLLADAARPAAEPATIALYDADWYTGSRETQPWIEPGLRAAAPAAPRAPVNPAAAFTPRPAAPPRLMRAEAPASALVAPATARVAIDASVSATSRGSVFGALAGTMALNGSLRQSGARLRLEGLAGTYAYDAGGRRIDTTQTEGSALVGYEWVMPRATFAAFIGAGVKSNELSAPDPANKVAGTGWGLKASVEGYANPTDATMVAGYASYSTNHGAYYTRLKAGYAAFDARGPLGTAFVGPEVSFLGDDFYRQWRVGAHLTGLRIGALQLGVAGGYASDAKQGAGAYGILDARLTF